MSVIKLTEAILAELSQNLGRLKEEETEAFVNEILRARHIFTAGAGRSGVAMRAFTNRLMHLGLSVSMVGEISSPRSHPGDLLIIGSGSGETESLAALAGKAKKNGVKIALITIDAGSTIAKMADTVVTLPGYSPRLSAAENTVNSFQPMGNVFEQMSFLVYDAVVMELMERMGETAETMYRRHADME